ncbi:MAG: hypothetical protein DWQ01_02080 [Planctomycetota bacterium]|nr:MAG: hypothetical protein DWQ01_02080 [Planctomycetota bacterium]
MKSNASLQISPWVWVLPFLVVNILGWLWLQQSLSAGAPDSVRLLRTEPQEALEQASALRLCFDRPLIDSLEQGQDLPPEAFLQWQPPLQGSWIWQSPKQLEFVLEQPLQPGRVYRVEVLDNFEELSGWRWLGERVISFATSPLEVAESWIQALPGDAFQIQLRFNQPVALASLREHVKILDLKTGDPLDWQEAYQESGGAMALVFNRPKGTEVELRLGRELTGEGREAVLPLGQDWVHRFTLPVHFSLLQARFSGFESGDRASVEFLFSAPLDRAFEPAPIRVEPELPEAKVRWHRWRDRWQMSGAFEPGRNYRFFIPAGVVAKDGRRLEEAQEVEVQIPDRKPRVHLPWYRGFLSPRGALQMPLEVVNLKQVEVVAERVLPNNLVPYLQGHRRRATTREAARRTFDLDLNHNQVEDAVIELGRVLESPLGIHHVKVRGVGRAWTSDWAVVALTDIALTAKRGRKQWQVWATSLHSAKPMAGVEVEARSYNNQVLARGRTNASGLLSFSVPADHPDGQPWVLLATRGQDQSYLILDRNPWSWSGADAEGRRPPQHYDLQLYSERGVYRPGETVHLSGLMRQADGRLPGTVPVEIEVERPDGQVIRTLPAETGDQGWFHLDVAIEEDAQTGPWRFRASIPGENRVLGDCFALVEAFIPARMEMKAAWQQPQYFAGTSPTAVAEARYLFGAAAAALPLKVTWRLQPKRFHSERFPDYRFGPLQLTAENRSFSGIQKAALDKEGRWQGEIELDAQVLGRFQLTGEFTVSEPGSRSVHQRADTIVDTAPRHLGMAPPVQGWVPPGSSWPLPWVQVNGQDQTAEPGDMVFKLWMIQEQSVLVQQGRRMRWQRQEELRLLQEETVAGADRGQIPVQLPAPGRYRAQLIDVESGLVTEMEWTAAEGEAEARALALASGERLQLSFDQESYRPGDRAQLQIQSPYPGTLYLCLETDEVLQQQVLDWPQTQGTLSLQVPPGVRGDAFVSASLVRPVQPEESSWQPHRAQGMVRLKTDHRQRNLPLQLHLEGAEEAPWPADGFQVIPGQTVEVRAVLPPEGLNPSDLAQARVHLWAVDEGVLQATEYSVPDPIAHFFGRRRPWVRTVDMFGDLLPDQFAPESWLHIGGDERSRIRRRRNPVPSRRRPSDVLWFESRPLDENGHAKFALALPPRSGALRVMAVVAAGDRYGRIERRLKLQAPLMAEVGRPRFLAPGDQTSLPVKIFNRGEEAVDLHLQWNSRGPIRFRAPQSASIAAQDQSLLWLQVEAVEPGTAALDLELYFQGKESKRLWRESLEFPVRPGRPLHGELAIQQLPPGGRLRFPVSEQFEGPVWRRLEISPLPQANLRPALEQLLAYPYGCLEQTSSRLLALLEASIHLQQNPESGQSREKLVADLIRRGLQRLASFQTAGGGLAYWPGSNQSQAWGSAYAATVLLEAQEQGFELPRGLLEPLLDFLTDSLAALNPSVPPSNRALSCRVLVRAGRPPHPWMNRLSEQAAELDLAARAHLAAAWLDLGRRDRAQALLLEDSLTQNVGLSLSRRLTSQTHQEAVLLDVLLDLQKEHPWVPVLVDRIWQARQQGHWRNTLETASAFRSLSRWQAAFPQRGDGPVAARWQMGEERYALQNLAGQSWQLEASDQEITLQNEGAVPIYAVLSSEGFAAAETSQEYDRGLRVRRRWLQTDGRDFPPEKWKLGDLVIAEIELTAPGLPPNDAIDNVVVVDALPAALEVENPRLSSSQRWASSSSASPDRVEFLDDRVLLFASARREPAVYFYPLRVVGHGSFEIPPLQASCMYEPALASISGGGRVDLPR